MLKVYFTIKLIFLKNIFYCQDENTFSLIALSIVSCRCKVAPASMPHGGWGVVSRSHETRHATIFPGNFFLLFAFHFQLSSLFSLLLPLLPFFISSFLSPSSISLLVSFNHPISRQLPSYLPSHYSPLDSEIDEPAISFTDHLFLEERSCIRR